jgi:hypothetical protein
MKTLLALALALTTFAAQAEENVFKSTTLTPYQELQEWFAEGIDIPYMDFSRDYHIGRCFDLVSQARPTAAIMASMERRTGDDAGPGFPGSEKKIFQFTAYAGADPATFDRFPWLPNGTDGRREFRQVAAQNWHHFSPITNLDSLTHYYDIEPNGRQDDLIEIVQGTEYMISKRTNLITQNRNGRFSPAGEVLQMCYYFIRAMK